MVRTAATLMVLVVIGGAWLWWPRPAAIAPATPGSVEVLPTELRAPGPWSTGEGVVGPIVAAGLAQRHRAEGWSEVSTRFEMYAISAVDGRSRWLDLPGAHTPDRVLVDWWAVSPDGRWLGWSRLTDDLEGLLGWSVLDTITGEVRTLDAHADQSVAGETLQELEFSGDSRYLLTTHLPTPDSGLRTHVFTAWDVTSGTRQLVEKPGTYWLPTLGSAPTGVVWSRGSTVHRSSVDDGTHGERRYRLGRHAVDASWGPDDRAFAWIGKDGKEWKLYAGSSMKRARTHETGVKARQILGWRDARHVVVDRDMTGRHGPRVVDIGTGQITIPLTYGSSNYAGNPPVVAAGAWDHRLVAAPPLEGMGDPRRFWHWGLYGIGGLTAIACLVWWRRRA